MKIHRTPISVALLGAALAGCGSSDSGDVCLSADEAEVCVAQSGGDLEVTASGLAPGSVLLLSTASRGEVSYPIVETGSPDGEIGLLGDVAGEAITISATAASGERIDGEIVVGG